MTDSKQLEIPQDLRELALQNIDQAREVYHRITELADKAQQMMKAIIPPNPISAGLTEVQERATRFTQQNLDASFSLATELAKAKDLQEALQIQSRHAQLQMHACALQAQELGAMVSAATQKGELGKLTGLMSS